jgi:hypothetical protein
MKKKTITDNINTNNTTKVKYCPLISNMLNKKNKKIKNPIILSFIEYLTIYEKINIRSTCKQWNEIIKQKLPFLGKENYTNCVMNKNVISVGYNSNNSNNSHISNNMSDIYEENSNKFSKKDFYFENSDQKFSKKKVLVKLISSKNFNTIKSKISLGEMTKPKNLTDE